MSDNGTSELKPVVTKQMFLFQLLEKQDINYSNFVEFYDHIPKFPDLARKRYWDYKNVTPTMSTEFTFSGERFLVTIKPGRIEKDGKDVLVYPSAQREESVYDALRKLATNGHGAFFGNNLGTQFTLRALQTELKRHKKTYALDEIKESLEVLRSAEMSVKSTGGAFKWEPSYLSNMALATRDQYEEQGRDAKCFVMFDNLVSDKVLELEFREYNYSIAQSCKNAISKYLIKRMDNKYHQASLEMPYGPIKMSTVFQAVFRTFDKKMSNNTRLMAAAIKEMMDRRRLVHHECSPIYDSHDKRKIVDYYYTLYPHQNLIDDIKRFHAKRSQLMNLNNAYDDKDFDQLDLMTE